MFLNNCLKVVGAAVTYFYGVFIEDFVVAVFLWEMQRQRNNRKRRSRDELHWTNRRNF